MTSTKKRRPQKTEAAWSPEKAQRKFPVVPVIGGVVVVGIILALVLNPSPGGLGSQLGEPAVSGETLTLFSGGGFADESIGVVAPEVRGEDFKGNPVEITHDGTPKGIVFVAHWCPFCQQEIPEVRRAISAGLVPDGVELVTVSTGTNSARDNYPPSEWLDREDWQVPVIVDDAAGTVASAYGLSGFPYWVFLSGEGEVIFRSSGVSEIAVLSEILTTMAAQ